MIAKQNRQFQNSQSTGEQHGCGGSLDGKLDVRPNGTNIVVNSKHENQGSRQQDGQSGTQGESETKLRIDFLGQQRDGKAQKESKKDGNATQAGQRAIVQVASDTGLSNPATRRRRVPNKFGKNERKQ